MGVADIITDVMLIVFPIPIVIRSSAFKLKRKISLILLFSLSSILVGITAYRVKSVIGHRGRQQYRSVFASGEILAATAVSNAVIIGSFLRDRGVKKQKYKHTSSTASNSGRTSRRQTMTALNNDSDSDLFRDMCYRTASELESQFVPRAPPMAAISPMTTRDDTKAIDAYFPGSNTESSRDSQESEPKTAVEPIVPDPHEDVQPTLSPTRKRTVSFCDPGGLLENDSSRSSTLAPSPSTTSAQDFASPTPYTRRGSRNILADLGGLLSPILSAHRRPSDETDQLELQDQQPVFMTPAITSQTPTQRRTSSPMPQLHEADHDQSLQDIGGLLGPPSNPGSHRPSRTTSLVPPNSNSNSRRPSPVARASASNSRHPSPMPRRDQDPSIVQELNDIGGLLGPASNPGSALPSRISTPDISPTNTRVHPPLHER
jgi:hypothetical protein